MYHLAFFIICSPWARWKDCAVFHELIEAMGDREAKRRRYIWCAQIFHGAFTWNQSSLMVLKPTQIKPNIVPIYSLGVFPKKLCVDQHHLCVLECGLITNGSSAFITFSVRVWRVEAVDQVQLYRSTSFNKWAAMQRSCPAATGMSHHR